MFTTYCMSENFDVQSKAFIVFSSVLKLYPKTSATYIKANSDLFFNYYNEILKNGNYVVSGIFFTFVFVLFFPFHFLHVLFLFFTVFFFHFFLFLLHRYKFNF